MSHFTTIKTQIKDIEAVKAACAELGLKVEKDAIARGYYGNDLKGEYVIRLKGPYDIALNRNATSTFDLATDWYAGHVEREVGKEYRRLIQLYGVHKATIEARRKGWQVQRVQRGEEIHLTIIGLPV